MEKNLLIAGKELPAGAEFAEKMAAAGFHVVAAGDAREKKPLPADGITVAPWNRSSAISARSLVIQAETAVGPVNNAVLYFDGPAYAAQFASFSPDECPRVLDAAVAGYEYLAMEILDRFERRKMPGKLVFVLKRHPCARDALRSAALKNGAAALLNPLTAAAQTAFAAFAENTAAFAGNRAAVTVLLVSGDYQNQIIGDDGAFAAWLSGYMDAVDALKTKPNAKTSSEWIKAGARNPGPFALFR